MRRAEDCCLLIAGLDPSAGAGLLADVKTCAMLGVHALGISTANTVQHEAKFAAVRWENLQWMKEQVLLLKEKYDWKAVKIGLIQNAQVLGEMVDLLKSINPEVKIVWDPIISASAGFDFNKWKIDELKDILPNLELFTPNISEIESITNHKGGRLEQFLYCNVLVKSARQDSNKTYDLLSLVDGDETIELAHTKLDAIYLKHGSGCFYSTAITALLAKNYSLTNAVEEAGKLTEQFLLSSETRTGYHFNINQKLIES